VEEAEAGTHPKSMTAMSWDVGTLIDAPSTVIVMVSSDL
jgi:hypothetical protein